MLSKSSTLIVCDISSISGINCLFVCYSQEEEDPPDPWSPPSASKIWFPYEDTEPAMPCIIMLVCEAMNIHRLTLQNRHLSARQLIVIF